MKGNETELYAIQNTCELFGTDAKYSDIMTFKNWIEDKILDMLNNDFNGLVNLLYRIDVYENKAKSCFDKQNREIAKCLADLIWNRQMDKAKTRYNK